MPPKGKQVLGMPKGKHFFGTAKVGEKGQIVIPKEARDVFSIAPGDTLLIFGDEESGILVTRTDVLSDLATDILNKSKRNGEEK